MTRHRRRPIAAGLLLALLALGAANACERVTLQGEGGSSSDPNIDIGVRF
ncbi:hypothetical protein KAJ83_04010 [Marivibrio halodurans]|uniref:Uncharacterized protein n=1 Tax=Marivibrio halodurans TaxID=2039722 RepID=A0A8J7RX52_9PROT|nr:hypothetical protein [Marivibrio halodurans]MBP5856160.1 hypothetical protein [Marivibrio halodurans]